MERFDEITTKMQEKEDIEPNYTLYHQEVRSEEVQEIITAVPKWIVRWGISLVFLVLASIVLASSLINYPDIVKTSLRVNSLNSPKTILAHQSGKLTALLVTDGANVKENEILAFLESSANPRDILVLAKLLNEMQQQLLNGKTNYNLPANLNLGEIQGAYQNFFQEFMQYQATLKNGYYLNRKAFLQKDLQDIKVLKAQIQKQQEIQKSEYANTVEEYKAYQKLYEKKVISRSEFAQQENKYLASKYPLQQSETALLTNNGSYSAKEKELMELDHTIVEQQSKFTQALGQCIFEVNGWILQHVFKSPIAGKLSYAGIIEQNQNIAANQEVFVVNPGNTDFFGEIQIPQYNMGKIKQGANTLVKLRSYPFEQYGMIRGKLSYISDVAYRDSVFIAKVSFDHFENKDKTRKIVLKNGMQADAEIITRESSLLQRFLYNITKMLNSN